MSFIVLDDENPAAISARPFRVVSEREREMGITERQRVATVTETLRVARVIDEDLDG